MRKAGRWPHSAIRARANCCAAVSYTHLDVYKRQEPGSVEAAAGEPVITATVTIKGAKEAADQAKGEIEPVFGEAVTQDIDVTDGGAGAALKQGLADTFRTPITQRILIAKVGGVAGGGKGSGNTFSKYAEGGRADEASIFGEAGPEWAIPEEHSARTASLLRCV